MSDAYISTQSGNDEKCELSHRHNISYGIRDSHGGSVGLISGDDLLISTERSLS